VIPNSSNFPFEEIGTSKIGRNSPCPCGNGKKFKHCHGSLATKQSVGRITPELVTKRFESWETQRKKQQGYGRPIVSCELNGVRQVQIGDKVLSSPKWQTFHDFLVDFLKTIFDEAWFATQSELPEIERHQLVAWMEMGRGFINEHSSKMGAIRTSPVSGALLGVLDLAYSLFLVQHNCGIPPLVVTRLREPSQFLGAFYEMWVAGCMIRAGFELTFEDESDSTCSHCEFTAKDSRTGKSFSVEAKRREPGDRPELVGRNLKNALKKQAVHTRIVMIEANLATSREEGEPRTTMKRALEGLREREIKAPFFDHDSEPAYVVVTNSPYQHHLHDRADRWAIAEGYKIADFKLGRGFASVREMVESRDRHTEIYAFMQSLSEHNTVPVTFDGDIPELVFGLTHNRLLIGNWYVIPTGANGETQAELVSAVVVEGKKSAMCIMRCLEGKNHIISCPLTGDELAGYKQHPETFFGQVQSGGNARDPLDMYDFTLTNYSKTPKARLLEFMKTHKDVAALAELPQPELARIYAERFTESLISQGVFAS